LKLRFTRESILRVLSTNSSFGSLNDIIEALWVSYGNFTQHLTVQLNVGFFAAIDELTVSYASLPAGSTQPYNPKTSEISLAAFAVDSGIDGSSHTSFFGQAIIVTRRSAVSLYCFEDSFLSSVSCRAFSYSWHISFFLSEFSTFRLAGGS